MRKKELYVKRETLQKIKARYILVFGQRSNGKSFAVKEDVIKSYFEKGEQFGYIRRYKEDCKQYMIEQYFADIICDSKGVNHLLEWSEGKYNAIVCRKSEILFAYIKEDGTVEVGEKFGNMFGLNWFSHYKSLAFPKIRKLVFEEFVTDSVYLGGINGLSEPKILMNLVSTIFRDEKGTVYLIGNTISRISPYFKEWNLVNALKQKENTIEYYDYNYIDENGKAKTEHLAVYMTHSKNTNSGMFFGNTAKAITSTVWETNEYPHLPSPKEEYDIIYTVVFEYDYSKFLMEFLKDKNNNYVWFVTPKTSDIQPHSRVISNKPYIDNMVTSSFIGLTDQEKFIFNFIKQDKICYSDNLTGTEFNQCYKQIRKVIF